MLSERDAAVLSTANRENAVQSLGQGGTYMKAIAVFPGQPNSVHIASLPKPSVAEIPNGRGVLVKVLRVGVDGTECETHEAYARSEDRVKALEKGFQLHLAKPIDPAELIATVAALAKRGNGLRH